MKIVYTSYTVDSNLLMFQLQFIQIFIDWQRPGRIQNTLITVQCRKVPLIILSNLFKVFFFWRLKIWAIMLMIICPVFASVWSSISFSDCETSSFNYRGITFKTYQIYFSSLVHLFNPLWTTKCLHHTFPSCCIIGNSWPVLHMVVLTKCRPILVFYKYSQFINANAELQRILVGVKTMITLQKHTNVYRCMHRCTSINVISEISFVKVSRPLLVIHILNKINLTSWPWVRRH